MKTKSQMDELISFFRARQGKAYGFRFKDLSDFQASDEIIATADGIKTIFNLKKIYTNGGVNFERLITKPVDNSVDIYVDDVLITSGFAIDYTSGEITFDSAPADGDVIKADFEFDVPVRFDTDRLSASLDSYGVHSWNNIPIVEIR